MRILQGLVRGSVGTLGLAGALVVMGFLATVVAAAGKSAAQKVGASQDAPHADRVILFVLEGVGKRSLEAGPMPVLSGLVEKGATTWSANNPTPSLRLPSVASIFTGLPMDRHGVTWDRFDFSRGYPRAPMLFDYIDLSGGKDTAVFFMDESLYQLARPEPYIDYQVCGPLRPECTTGTVVKYIRDYMVKGASGEGYGRRISDLPHLLVVHFPEAGRAGAASGWTSESYSRALRDVDRGIGDVLDIYRELRLLERAAVFVMSLNGEGGGEPAENGSRAAKVPWIAWGYGIRAGYEIKEPVRLQDTGATIMDTFGLETYTEWDSRSVNEVFAGAAGVKAKSAGKR